MHIYARKLDDNLMCIMEINAALIDQISYNNTQF